MATQKVTAAFQSELHQGESIVYLPEGKHTISANKGGKPTNFTVSVDDRVLASFREDLSKRHESNVRPFAGFDHETGKASFIPKEFRYETGVGLVLDVEWTQAGRTAIEGKDYSYFSPTFLVSEDGIPIGLPKRGEIGSLVNDPAFEEIPRIAASHQETNTITMIDHLIELGLVEAGHDEATALDAAKSKVKALRDEAANAKTVKASNDETAAKVAELEKEKADLEAENKTLKEDAEKAVDAAATEAVAEAVTAGRIAPQDDAAKSFWTSAIKADKNAITVLRSIAPKVVLGEKVLAGRADVNEDKPAEKTGLARASAAFAAKEKTK